MIAAATAFIIAPMYSCGCSLSMSGFGRKKMHLEVVLNLECFEKNIN